MSSFVFSIRTACLKDEQVGRGRTAFCRQRRGWGEGRRSVVGESHGPFDRPFCHNSAVAPSTEKHQHMRAGPRQPSSVGHPQLSFGQRPSGHCSVVLRGVGGGSMACARLPWPQAKPGGGDPSVLDANYPPN